MDGTLLTRDARFTVRIRPLHELLVDETSVRTPSGEPIDVLYRQTYPIEHLIDDRAADGDLIGIRLLDLNHNTNSSPSSTHCPLF